MKLNELRDTSYEIAKSKGWHDADMKRSFADLMALVISELAEALEEHRKGKPACNIEYVKDGVVACTYAPTARSALDETLAISKTTALKLVASGHKPEGVVIELADALIRIGDCAGACELHLGHGTIAGLANTGAPWESDATTFGAWFLKVCESLCAASAAVDASEHTGDEASLLVDAIWRIARMAMWLGISAEELERAIEIKHAYNRTREHRHGGKAL